MVVLHWSEFGDRFLNRNRQMMSAILISDANEGEGIAAINERREGS